MFCERRERSENERDGKDGLKYYFKGQEKGFDMYRWDGGLGMGG